VTNSGRSHYHLRRSFEGQTVLVTGATSCLDLAGAIHFAKLEASVIITSRSLSRGQAAKEQIEKSAGIIGQGKIHLIELDISRYPSCVVLIAALKRGDASCTNLDVAVLNADLIHVDLCKSPEGWYISHFLTPICFQARPSHVWYREQTIQVKTLSTTLLGVLLLQ
jgi:NAD(P)-dependent dehydrogenase (short-subunit alcohol dehydrogenase family)